jgi:multiple sugar transport system permease protein
MKPGLATMGIFTFVGSWNNLIMPLMLINTESKYTLPMMVQLLKADIYQTEYGSIYLGIAMSILPLFLVYLVFSKFIIAGVALGGVKE